MKFRPFASVFMGLSLVAAPALAKDAPAVTPPKTYPTVVDTNPANKPQDVLLLDQ